MCHDQANRKAFTLVELLTVISILALLVAVIVPVFVKGIDVGRFMHCQSNMRVLGTAGLGFAADHSGRGPGSGQGHVSATDPNAMTKSWADVLNDSYYHENKIVSMMNYSAGETDVPKNKVCCPCILAYYNSTPPSPPSPRYFPVFPRPYLWNAAAESGDGTQASQFDAQSICSYWTAYSPGAVLTRFPNPSGQFLATEGECESDLCPAGSATAPFSVTVGDSGNYPRYTAQSGNFAFRHMLPNDRSMYQTQARAGFLFFDGHVDAMGPSDQINSTARFSITGQ